MSNDGAFFVHRYAKDPVRFVREVLGADPDQWQIDFLQSIRDNARTACKSGHGVGKSTGIAWAILWFISTRPNPQIVVTANTKHQLDGKTWRELSKWHMRARNRTWFEKTATKFFLKDARETWFCSAIPWSENKPEAFAGLHEKHVLVLFDEASGIPAVIWETCEGAMTTTGARWAVVGNPTRNDGAFAECFGKMKHRWNPITVDSRTSKFTDKAQIEQWLQDYGEDSDFFRVRVRGELPKQSGDQFISYDDVRLCLEYKSEAYESFPLIFGVDVARFGDDQNVICMRRGRKVLGLIKWRGIDGMQTAARIVEAFEKHKPSMVFVDGGGVGGPIIDRVRMLIGDRNVVEVNFGSSASDDQAFANKRAEMWSTMREALRAGLELPNDAELTEELTGPLYKFDARQRLLLERKEDMKSRGLASPDNADALALTYAHPVASYTKRQQVADAFR